MFLLALIMKFLKRINKAINKLTLWKNNPFFVCLFSIIVFLITLLFIPVLVSSQENSVPKEFYTNYQVADDFEEMNDVLSTLDAIIKVWQIPEAELFSTLSKNFKVVFEFFPKSREYTQIYKQCELLVWELSQWYSVSTYTSFKKSCFDSVRDIVQTVQASNTVKARVNAKPIKWSAPLNVTLDAKESIDPSDDTIPEDNYFWYYKDISWSDIPIGKWPIINYTFDKPGRYVVHLTVRSANNIERGVFDWSDTAEITVSPKTADLVVYLNGKLMDEQEILKIGTQDAQWWFSIDATATTPLWWRTIQEHTRTIKGDDVAQSYVYEKTFNWAPGQIDTLLPYNGVYTVDLEIVDNENNKVTEKYQVSVSDPVSLIKYTPNKWDTQTEYRFDASASYSLTSRVNKYQWSIIDPEWQQIELFESRELNRDFKLPGMYTIKLTVIDDLNSSSFDIKKVYVESSPPIPSFVVEPLADWENPSQFVLDASWTRDVDFANGVDELTYQRTFSRPDVTNVNSQEDSWKKVLITFDDIWVHEVTLTVRDSYGKSVSIKKNITVESVLRPELLISPITGKRWEDISFVARANKEISLYTRTLWDGSTQTTDIPKISHLYKQAWIYPITLHVVTPDWSQENTIKRLVFMWQKDEPTIQYQVKAKNSEYLQQDARCNVDWVDMPAFEIDRYEQITLDVSESIGVEWKKTWVKYYIQTEPDFDGTIFEKSQLNHSFASLWCKSLLVTIEDLEVWKSTQANVWFMVKNALPTIDNLLITFPQSTTNQWLWIGIWIQQQPEVANDLFSISRFDPLLVRVSASWVKDSDANQISRFVWYFYNTANPDQLIDVKVTPASVPYASFSVQRIPWEYSFGVRVIDTDDWEIDSTEVLWKWPILFFPPSDTNPDIPLVTLSASSTTLNVGEEIVFTPTSSVLSNRSDFDSSRYYVYDLDGDWKQDTWKLKSPNFTHVFDTPGVYKPAVTVVYREKKSTWRVWDIIVKQWVKPQFLYDTFWPYALIKNTTIGKVDDQILCADINACGDWSNFRINDFYEDENSLQFIEYPSSGVYQTKLISTDEFWSKLQSFEPTFEIEENEKTILGLLSIPDAQESWSWYTISVWSNLENEVSMYISFTWSWNCFADIDINIDTDGDWDPLYDKDILCNTLYTKSFDPDQYGKTWRIYSVDDGILRSQRLHISFLDADEQELELPSRLLWPADRLDSLIEDVESGWVQDPEWYYLDTLLNLRQWLDIQQDRVSLLDQLFMYIKNSNLVLQPDHKESLDLLLLSLEDESLQPVYSGNPYQLTKSTILTTYFRDKEPIKEEFNTYFNEFDEVNGDKVAMKSILDTIYLRLNELRNEWLIDDVDLNAIKLSLCNTIVYYELESKTCGTSVSGETELKQEEVFNEEYVQEESSTWISWIVKRVLIWIWVILIAVVILIVIFAIKAKNQQKELEE